MDELVRVADRWLKIQNEIQKLASRPIVVVGATKYQPERRIAEAIQSGLTDLGVNYAQDGETLREQFASLPLQWHFIGHIQSRKVKYLVNYQWVHSLDRIEIVRTLAEKLRAAGKTISGLIEINIAGEAAKSGIRPEDLPDFVSQCQFPEVRIRGLMCMPPPLEGEARRPYFRKARELFERHAANNWDTLSMGTSEDYPVAISEGATMIRLGTNLFGPRA